MDATAPPTPDPRARRAEGASSAELREGARRLRAREAASAAAKEPDPAPTHAFAA